MFDKSNTSTDKYKLNKKTTLSVKNVRIEDELGNTIYRTEVTLKHKLSDDKPLTFSDPDEVSDFVCNIDLTDDQLPLPGLNEETRKDLQ